MRTTFSRSLVAAVALLSSAAPALAAVTSAPPVDDAQGWQDLAAPVLRPDGRAFITIGAGAGGLATLRLRSTTGEVTLVRQLVVEFPDGSTLIRRNLTEELRGGRPYKLDLGGEERLVKRLVVYGDAGAQLDVSAR